MKARVLFSVMLVAVPLSLACGGDDAEKPEATNCQKYCATGKSLNCANDNTDQCVLACDQQYQAALQLKPTCKAEFDAAATCLAGRSAGDFECSSSGRAQPKPQVCAIEQSQAEVCFRT